MHVFQLSQFTKHVRISVVTAAALLLAACGGNDGNPPQTQASQKAATAATDASGDFLPSSGQPLRRSVQGKSGAYTPGRVLVQYTPDAAKPANAARLNAAAMTELGFSVVQDMRFPTPASSQLNAAGTTAGATAAPHMALLDITASKLSVQAAIARLKTDSRILHAEPDYIKQLHLAPNDSFYSLQWNHKNTGQCVAGTGGAGQPACVLGTVGADISSEAAWTIQTGSAAAAAPVVAVIDCGYMLTHPDLAGNWWVNPSPGASGIANDLNGADFSSTTPDGDPTFGTPTAALPGCTHGTNVAGVIGARGNNTTGITGVMWNSRIMALRAGDNTGSLATSAIIAAINYALGRKAAGVNLVAVNMSFGSANFSQSEFNALSALNTAGVLVTASAGNDGSDELNFPASFNLPNIINVGASDRFDGLANFSNYGPNVHLVAPGDEVPSTSFSSALSPVAGYSYTYGTSFSAPMVAGVAGLLANQFPTETMQQRRTRILKGATFLPSLLGKTRIPGRLNAHSALTGATTEFPAAYFAPEQITKGATHLLKVVDPIVQGTTTTGMSAAFVGVNVPITDNGVWPDAVAGDGVYTGLIKPTVLGANAVGINRVTAVTSVPSNFLAQVKDAANYQVVSSTATWSEPVGAPGVASVFSVSADDELAFVASPFPISLYGGVGASELRVSSNGFACVNSTACSALSSARSDAPAIPGKGLDLRGLGVVAPWWYDWVVDGNASSNVFTHTVGAAPNRKFIITWKNAFPYAATGGDSASFQVQFYEGQSKITFAYLDVTTSTVNIPGGGTAAVGGGELGSVGVQHFNGRIGTRLSYNTAASIVVGSRDLIIAGSFPEIAAASDEVKTAIEGLRGASITNGCLGGTAFCSTDPVNRIQMATFLARSLYGHDLIADYSAVPAFNFPDVTGTANLNYTNALKANGITNGCTGGTLYCPNTQVNREQMALFLMRAVRGGSFVPPTGVGLFSDAPLGDPLAGTLEEVKRMGITNGCLGGTQYCRSPIVTREQMALFLQRAFLPWDYK
jgi:hypothetical protein